MRSLRKIRASSLVASPPGLPLGATTPPGRWRVWLPDAEQEPDRGNACFGIAVGLALSLPIWLVLGLVTFAVAL
jgi:hypothetical protein